MSDAQRSPLPRRLTWRDAVSSAVGLVVATLLIAYGLPHFLDTSWAQIGAQLGRVRPGTALVMALLLLAGLFSYTWVLIGSLPGLGHVQALKANAVSATAANLLPLGGAVGIALMGGMFRSWGFALRSISTSILVTGLWNLLARVALPILGALVLVAGPVDAPDVVIRGAWVAGALGLLLVLVAGVFVLSDGAARVIARTARRGLAVVGATTIRGQAPDELLTDQRHRVAGVVRSGGLTMALGMTGQFVLLFGLYWFAAHVVGLDLPLAELVCAYTFRQLLTVVAVTPGGLGVTEVGTAGMLVLLGGDPGAASATALLYAIYAHVVVVPFGLGAVAAWWFGSGRTTLVDQDPSSLRT
ncbi:lysylphosphatidylglycerol synthase transmembrane domain-containing protein [Serinicoccus kebangsaanensis]|uniref:lysylphosphatidylglycerol synthase transmembrane domain-containing protein n=1 Tax=Serinicoccus kebangsaanensis TaxID=2602069 RepID=UPI00178C7474|nr:lysylphosphatidylglycerol synthase transmembrane domain-containing protein [Serinicoccus kebangsaanensis]